MKGPTQAIIAFAGFLTATACLHTEIRTFTSYAVITLKCELVSVAGDTVTIKREEVPDRL